MSAHNIALTIVWQSVSGWDNRPDYFDVNDLKLIADIAYLAQVKPDQLQVAFGGWKPADIQDVRLGFQNGQGSPLLNYLKAYGADPNEPPLQCDLSQYGQFHPKEGA